MAQYNKNNFKATKNAQFADNTTGLITELVMRTFGENIADSFVSIVDNLQPLTSATGTDDYVLSGGITAYSNSYAVLVKFINDSLGPSTMAVNSLPAKKLFIDPNIQANNGDIPSSSIFLCVYDSELDGGNGGFYMIGYLSNSIDGGTL